MLSQETSQDSLFPAAPSIASEGPRSVTPLAHAFINAFEQYRSRRADHDERALIERAVTALSTNDQGVSIFSVATWLNDHAARAATSSEEMLHRSLSGAFVGIEREADSKHLTLDIA